MIVNIIILSIGILIISIFTTIAGIGGGGIIIPYLTLIGGYKLTEAIPLSICCIFFDCLIRNIYLYKKTVPRHPKRYLMNLSPGLLISPSDAMTSWIGVIMSRVLPSGITLIFVIAILLFSFIKTFINGYKTLKTEKNIKLNNSLDNYIIIDGIEVYIDKDDLIEPTKPNGETIMDRISSLFLVLLSIITAGIFSFSKPDICTIEYWYFLIGFIIIIISILLINVVYVKNQYNYRRNNEFDFISSDFKYNNIMIFKLIVSSMFTGAISTYLGIGGGMLINPLLLNLGMAPHIIIASTAVTTFFSSMISLLNYIASAKLLFTEAGFFGITSMVGSYIGILITNIILKKYQNQYILIFFTCLILFVSLVALVSNSIFLGVDFNFTSIC